MDSSSRKYLHYVRKTLADAARLTPDLKSDNAVELSFDEIERGVVGAHAQKQLLALAEKAGAKNPGGRDGDEDRRWPIAVTVLPRVYGRRPHHGAFDRSYPAVVAPLMLQAKLHRDGTLVPDAAFGAPAIVPRDVLEPNRYSVSIGRVDHADAAYARHQEAPATWPALMQRGIEVLMEVLAAGGNAPDAFEALVIDEYECKDAGLAVMAGGMSSSFHIQNLLDLLQCEDAPAIALFDELVAQASDRPLLTAKQQASVGRAHLGQMECQYPLSESQREALMHHLSPQGRGRVLAVDGPPGTGKTTLLLSAIATLWVQRALHNADPPLIVATSTNNQAIINILRAFAKVKEDDGPLAGRWLDGIESYGLYFPAKRRNDEFDFPVHEMRGGGKDARFDAQRFENRAGLDQARTAFLGRFKKAFPAASEPGLADAAKTLHAKLQEQAAAVESAIAALEKLSELIGDEAVSSQSVSALQSDLQIRREACVADAERAATDWNGLRQLRADWALHQAGEPLWIRALQFFGFGQPRRQRDAAFWGQVAVSRPQLVDERWLVAPDRAAIESALADHAQRSQRHDGEAKDRSQQAQQRLRELDALVSRLRPLARDGDLSPAAIQAALDTGPRFAAFKLATHYWEARYLSHVEASLQARDAILDSKSPDRLIAQYRRVAMLHPCFVATLYTLPEKFIAWRSRTESLALTGKIDLLIVDEAGQVPPEIGAPAFALAEQALVVGDVDQIEPIWTVPDRIDGANALHSGVVADEAALQAFRESGLSAANGSLMRLAQRATAFAKFPARGRGMFLSEHRRCWPEIIRMCNVLVYSGKLRPLRADNGVRAIVPSVGFVHIPGSDRSRGGSRDNRSEAAAIAKWIAQRKDAIESAYDGEAVAKLLAVVTPFAAQSRCVRAALDTELGKGHAITVGTVHALQGAERRIVIFSPTYGLGTVPGGTFIDRNPSMLNVAISRAQDAFMVFGNMHLFHPDGTHPCAVVGKMLFGDGAEIADVPAELLVPGSDRPAGSLCRTLEEHRAVLGEAMATARSALVVVSPFLSEAALDADGIEAGIRAAVDRGVKVAVLSDAQLNQHKRSEFERCTARLQRAGARVGLAVSQGVHSKMLLVDRSWLVVGSFNWLSAVRNADSAYSRYESSIRYDGNEAFEMICKSYRDIQALVAAQHAQRR
ncbi:AAA domain-containing protein [Lysobacter enzymogenes]|uniref:AAA domain-containing protein n=1 Tax=Lysobacter enzymogenes TaxID=69 RepID=UPI003747E019